MDKLESGILALETEHGSVYVHPSGWERIYLLWTFRNFHSLPLKTLNSRQRNLVQRLPRCARQSFHPPDRTQLIGTVEDAPMPLFAEMDAAALPANIRFSSAADKRITRKRKAASTTAQNFGIAFPAVALLVLALGYLFVSRGLTRWNYLAPQPAAASNPQTLVQSKQNDSAQPETTTQPSASFQQSIAPEVSIAPAAVSIAPPNVVSEVAPSIKVTDPGTAVAPAANSQVIAAAVMNRIPDKPVPAHVIADSLSTNFQHATGSHAQQILFSGPPKKMVYPTAPSASTRGKVTLQALISTDGKVIDIRVISGSKLLCAAAANAIRQWRYVPILQEGEPVEATTNISFLFISEDVISISFPTSD